MSRGFPSMTALLGLVAIAGYQNRDKIAEFLNGLGEGKDQPAPGQLAPAGAGGGTGQPPAPTGQGGFGDIFEKFRDMVGGAGQAAPAGTGTAAGAGVGGSLSELLEQFRQNGHGEAADSWVNSGPNKSIESSQLAQAIGPDVLDTLTQRTGLSRDELLARLARELPDAVDKFTPNGRLPGA